MSTITLTRGISGSGKSTWAKQQALANPNIVRVNRDDIREELFGKQYHTRKPDPKSEEKVTLLQQQRAREALKSGKDVIIDDTNLEQKFVHKWIKFAESNGVAIKTKDFEIPLAEAKKRNKQRDRVVPDEVVTRQYNRLGPNGTFPYFDGQLKPRSFVYPESRKQAIIFDMDGTLNDVRLVRHFIVDKPKNWELFHRHSYNCPTNPDVVSILRDAVSNNLVILIVTARQEIYRETTEAWLNKHNIPFENMFMRKDGDFRPDYQAKKDILKEIRSYYDVVHAVDDNPNVRDLWKENDILTTVVPGFSEEDIKIYGETEHITVPNPIADKRCLRCGRRLKNALEGQLLGPECKKLA